MARIYSPSARGLKKPTRRPLLSSLKHAWLSTQVSHRGKYSIERLLALQEYIHCASRLRVFLVCIGTPLPMIVFVLAVECVPLQDPKAGWYNNYGLWIRSAIICGVIAFTMLVELKHLIEGVTISVWQAVFVLGCVMVGDTLLCIAAAANLAFPIPFMSVLMVPPLLAIVAGTLRIALGATGFKKMLVHPAQMYGFVLFILAQALTLLIYPVYQGLFDAAVDTSHELPVTLLLPIIKISTKNLVASSIYYMEDMMPESVIFTVDLFNAVYVSTSMQRASSITTVIVIVVADAFHAIFALRSLYETASEIKRRLNRNTGSNICRLLLLNVGCSMCQCRDKFEKQEYSQIQLRSCLRHKLSPTGRSLLAHLEKYSFKAPTKVHRRRLATGSILPIRLAENVKSLKRVTAKVNTASMMNIVPAKPVLGDSSMRKQRVLSSHAVLPSRILQRTLETLFTTECHVLTEYLESITPVFYMTFVYVMIRLPSAKYHTELEGITQENVLHTLQPVFVYGLLEYASFLVVAAAIRHSIGIHALYHLAFVLETQMSLVQSKLIVWMLLTLTFRLVHYGYDFSFEFSWIKDKK